MPFLIASDIHGSSSAFHTLVERYRSHNVEEMLLLGDLNPDYLDRYELMSVSKVLVRGNCDSSYDFQQAGMPLPPLVQRISWMGRTIVMTHGDRWPSPYGLSMRKHDIFCFGHIHQSRMYLDDDGILVLNPGSAAYPRGGGPASYMLLYPDRVELHALSGDTLLQGLAIAPLKA